MMDLNCSYNGTHGTYLTYKDGVVSTSMVLTVTTGLLSIAGCFLIMFTYVAYKNIRTKGRAMLFHLSVADLIIVLSHMVGLWNYKRFINNPEDIENSNRDTICISQGAFTLFGTVASLLWSNAIGFFMLLLVVNSSLKSEKINQVFYIVSCIVCWVIPAIIVTTNAAKHYFGFHTIGTAGNVITK